MSFYKRLTSLREKPNTARAYFKWTEEENEQLMNEVVAGMDFGDVAKKHQRTVRAVKLRVMSNALIVMKDRDLTLQDVAKLVYISVKDLEEYKQKQEQKATTPKVKKIVKTKREEPSDNKILHQDIMNMLTEIRDYLKIIVEK